MYRVCITWVVLQKEKKSNFQGKGVTEVKTIIVALSEQPLFFRPIFILLVLSCIVLSGCVVSYPSCHGTWPNLASISLDFMVELLKEIIIIFTSTQTSAYSVAHNDTFSALDAIRRMQICAFEVQTQWDQRPFILSHLFQPLIWKHSCPWQREISWGWWTNSNDRVIRGLKPRQCPRWGLFAYECLRFWWLKALS